MRHLALTVVGVALTASPVAQSAERNFRYVQVDVFTGRPLAGNQLAVFLDPKDLSADEMMAITREMGFSETTFVFPAEIPSTDFRVRIFSLNESSELPVAGHPTIGTVFALASKGLIAPGRPRVVLGLGIGPTAVDLIWNGSRLVFVWMQLREPEFHGTVTDVAAAAAALHIETNDIRRTGLPIQEVSCGAPFLIVPVATRAAVDRAELDRAAMGRLLDRAGLARRGVFIFSHEQAKDRATIYSRVLGFRVVEDPATGNASGPAASYLVHYGVVSAKRATDMVSQQGVKMGRPSEVHIDVRTSDNIITSVRIGGAAVLTAEGVLTISR